MVAAPAYFGSMESVGGLPPGYLHTIWGNESAFGNPRWMLNPQSGAAGHFGIMPSNYEAAGIDPKDLRASAKWTADYAKKGIGLFPNLDPLTAAAAHHYGGPNTGIWGPKTTEYVNKTRKIHGMKPITNAELVTRAGGTPRKPGPAGIAGARRAARSAMPTMPEMPTMGQGMEPLIPLGDMQQPVMGHYGRGPKGLLDAAFWFDLAAGMDPQMAPMQALAHGMSNAYSRADERRLAFEDRLTQGRQQQIENMLAQQQLTESRRQRQAKLDEIQRQRQAQAAYMQYLTPEQQAEFAATGGVSRPPAPRTEDLKTIIGPKGRPQYVWESEAYGKQPFVRPPQWMTHPPRTPEQELAITTGKNLSEYMHTRARGADESARRARMMQRQLERGLGTGAWETLKADVKKWGGFKDEDLANKEFFIAQAGEFVMDQLQRMSGATSDQEQAFLANIGPDIGKTEEGNYLILEVYRRNQERASDMASKFPEYIRENLYNASEQGFRNWYFEKYGSNIPEFDVDEILRDFRSKRNQGRRRRYSRTGLGMIPPPPMELGGGNFTVD